ncbi:hypothetical protein EC912_11058 [Luteibacter rhizovicinus]|uniref:Uncharacterized protein n=1 Tax=Luteibacter rhizovicinus TaxID=242606 RepID=A0A4R3YJS0_9GAMM|nr:hypothetical protein EC912_11058 [Luteibacter rhizovicinus]
MRYLDGQEVMLNDVVDLGSDWTGWVVAVMDTRQYSAEHPGAQWGYLEQGAMVECPQAGLIHYVVADEDLVLIRRSASAG